MTRLIDAEILFEKVGNIKPKNKSEYELLGKFMNMITNSTTVEQRPHGEWIFKHNSADIWCSNCDENFDEIPQKFLFCPNCGSDNRPREGDRNEL